ncbi:MAG: antitoxin Xre-like helix-turn-helix domain-containing protein [Solimonas sp.]
MRLVPLAIEATPDTPQHKGADWEARRNAVGLRQTLSIANAWKLGQAELGRLLGATPRTLQRWRDQANDEGRLELSGDTVERMSYLLGIHKALTILLPTPDNQPLWLRNANSEPQFNGQPPLERMLSGQVADLYVIRHYLDGARG